MLRFLRFLKGGEGPVTDSERRFRRHEILGLANGTVLFAALAFILLRLPPTPWRLAGLGILLACSVCALVLRHRFWTDLENELRGRKQAEQEARAAEIAKGHFLADVSHEIRTPMNGILGLTELLLQDGLSPGQREKIALVRERLASFDSLGDSNLRADVVRAFLLQGERDLAALRNALPDNDAKGFAAAAHALCGSAGVLGGQALAEIAGELEALARQGDLAACAERLPILERELQAFAAELSA